MKTTEILAQIDEEIERLHKARALLSSAMETTTTKTKSKTTKAKTKTAKQTAKPEKSIPKKKRKMSKAGRLAIQAAQKKRWANQKKAAKDEVPFQDRVPSTLWPSTPSAEKSTRYQRTHVQGEILQIETLQAHKVTIWDDQERAGEGFVNLINGKIKRSTKPLYKISTSVSFIRQNRCIYLGDRLIVRRYCLSDLAILGSTALGAVIADMLALTAAMRTGRLRAARWRRPMTYFGMAAQSSITVVMAYFFLTYIKTPLAGFTLGINLPLVVEKLAQLSPSFTQPEISENQGFTDPDSKANMSLERLRVFLAKDDEEHTLR